MLRPLPGERLQELSDLARGLSETEVASRRTRYGTNAIIDAPSRGWIDIVRRTVSDPMIWFLVATSLLFVWAGDAAEAAVLAFALAPIVGMDAYLHRRTQASTEGLAGRLATTARVVRDGVERVVPSEALVPGDLVVVGEGEPFPADGLILAGRGLQVDESSLTGEAMPVRKAEAAGIPGIAERAQVDDVHWGLAGTRLLTGEARLCVLFTAGETLYGQIVRSARIGAAERTPLQGAIATLVLALVAVASVVCLGLAVTRYVQGRGLIDALVSAMTLAVAALPEEFPVVFTFFLGVGVYRLARRQALVRRAVVVEHIGRVTCICSDKTGTLTEGRLRLAHAVSRAGESEAEVRRIAALASRAASADPLDQAILASVPVSPADGTSVATFPFTEDRRRESSVRRLASGELICAVKGAPETILDLAAPDETERRLWQARAQELAASGHKVIACADRKLDATAWSGDEPGGGFVLRGLLAFEDPVRPGVAEAVAQALGAGIRVLMITGDHPETARAIAVDLGIGGGAPRVIRGEDLAATIAGNALDDVDVVARAMPAMKLDLVRALQSGGEIVAVTGDGVNDVPALQAADIGIAMGERGTRTAREVASIVLLDDNFRTIVRAIAEGRQLFSNLRLSFAYLLMIHIPLVVTAALLPFLGYPLLYLPAHIVWLELIIHPTALLVFQQLPAGPLAPVSRRRWRFFGWREWGLIALVGAVTAALVVFSYVRSLGDDHDIPHARAMALAVLILASVAITAAMSRLRTRTSILVVAAALASVAAFVQVPAIADALHLAPLHPDDWQLAGLGGLASGVLAFLLARQSARG